MKNIVSITVRLLIITIIAGLILGVVNAVTKEPIAEQQRIAADEARRTAFPEAASFEEMDVIIPEEYAIINGVYRALDANNEDIGVTASITTKGFSAGLNMTVGIGADGTIKGVIIGDHGETPGLGAKATGEWKDNFTGKPYDSPLTVVKGGTSNDYEISAIASATITSRAVTDAVNTATEFYTNVIGGAQ